jgi:hypothetical protein
LRIKIQKFCSTEIIKALRQRTFLRRLSLQMQEIIALSTHYGTEGIPNACAWALPGTPRQSMGITLAKFGKGIMSTYSLANLAGLAITLAPAGYVVEFAGDREVSFGAQQSPSDEELTQYMANITAPWEPTIRAYGKPWHVYLSPTVWRAGAQREIVLQPLPDFSAGKSPQEPNSHVPINK